MRLGSYECIIRPGSLAERVYGAGSPPEKGELEGVTQKGIHSNVTPPNLPFSGEGQKESLIVTERHRHRFEFDPTYREAMEASGFIVSATSPDGSLAEIAEIVDHPYMIATQAHPELISRPSRPHPLFMGLVRAMIEKR